MITGTQTKAPVVAQPLQNGQVNNTLNNFAEEPLVFCTVSHCRNLSLCQNWNVQHSDDELDLRHNHCRSARTARTCAAWSQGRQPSPRCPVFVCCPGLAVSPSGGRHRTWRVPATHQQEPRATSSVPGQCHDLLPAACTRKHSREEGIGT